jgi:cysteine desulfurase
MSHPIRIWGEESPRVPNTSRFSFLKFKTYENWVELLDLKGFAVSHGSACKAQIIEPSHVLLKMGATSEDALNSLRISVGPENTSEDIHEFLIALQSVLTQKEAQKS